MVSMKVIQISIICVVMGVCSGQQVEQELKCMSQCNTVSKQCAVSKNELEYSLLCHPQLESCLQFCAHPNQQTNNYVQMLDSPNNCIQNCRRDLFHCHLSCTDNSCRQDCQNYYQYCYSDNCL